jgi:integrase
MPRKRARRRANGEGSIFYRPKKKLWVSEITVGYDPETGKAKTRTLYGKTQEEVREKLLKVEMEKSLGARLDQDKVTLSEWLDRWLANYMQEKLRDTVYPSYEMNIRRHVKPYIGHITLKSLQTDDLQALFNYLLKDGRVTEKDKDINPGLSRRTVAYIRTIIKEAITQAIHNRLIALNPVDGTTLPPASKKEVVPFLREEAEQFLNSIKSHRLFAAYYLAFYTGLRRGEILGLMWKDIDFAADNFEVKRELVYVLDKKTEKHVLNFQPPKTQKSKRTIPMTEDLVKVLKSHRAKQDDEKQFFGKPYQDEDLVFCSEDGKRLWPRNFNRQYDGLLKQCGLQHKKPHAMRHTIASMLIEDGEDIRNVQEMLGHATLATTSDIYSHVMDKTKKKVMHRMNRLLNVDLECD